MGDRHITPCKESLGIGKGKGLWGVGERQWLPHQKKGGQNRYGKKAQDQLPLAGRAGEIGVGNACLLKGQST